MRSALYHGVEAILGAQSFGHAPIVIEQTNPAFTPRTGALGEIIQVDGLVGAMEPPDSDVGNGGREARSMVAGCTYPAVCGDSVQRGRIQRNRAFQGSFS